MIGKQGQNLGLTVSAGLVIGLCGCVSPDISRIVPEFCERQTAQVGEVVAQWKWGVDVIYDVIYSAPAYSGVLYFDGMEGPNRVRFRQPQAGLAQKLASFAYPESWCVDLENVDSEACERFKGMFNRPNVKGDDGEVYALVDQFFILIYAASENQIEYALTKSRLNPTLSTTPVPCS